MDMIQYFVLSYSVTYCAYNFDYKTGYMYNKQNSTLKCLMRSFNLEARFPKTMIFAMFGCFVSSTTFKQLCQYFKRWIGCSATQIWSLPISFCKCSDRFPTYLACCWLTFYRCSP